MEKIAYFDNAATTFPKPESVYEFTDSFYRSCGVNVGRGQHKLAAKASALVQETREMLLDLFHCPAKKIVFTHTATEALNHIIRGLQISDNYTMYISPFEHNAVTRVLTYLQGLHDIYIETLAVDKATMTYDFAKIKNQFAEKKPNWMIVSHASNVCGVVSPINELCKLSKEFGAVILPFIDYFLSDYCIPSNEQKFVGDHSDVEISLDFINELFPGEDYNIEENESETVTFSVDELYSLN